MITDLHPPTGREIPKTKLEKRFDMSVYHALAGLQSRRISVEVKKNGFGSPVQVKFNYLGHEFDVKFGDMIDDLKKCVSFEVLEDKYERILKEHEFLNELKQELSNREVKDFNIVWNKKTSQVLMSKLGSKPLLLQYESILVIYRKFGLSGLVEMTLDWLGVEDVQTPLYYELKEDVKCK